MKAFAVKAFAAPLEAIEIDDPVPTGTEVVVEVTRCGVCHSDLHIQEGFYDLGGGKRLSLADRGVAPPIIMGHEVLGRLVAKGPDAPIGDDQMGRTFIVYPWLGCGQCEICARDEENYCPKKQQSVGVHRPGGYAEKCLVPHPKYLIDADGIDHTLAATYSCSGLTAYSALKRTPIAPETDWLLLLGLGGVGYSGLQIAKAMGIRNIAVADVDPGKRELALKSGAAHAIDPREPDAADILARASGGVAAAIDFVGARQTAEFGIAALRKGGSYVVVGLFGGDLTVSLPLLVLKAATLRGSHVGNLKELRELIDLVKAGKVAPMPVEQVAVASVNESLDRLRAGKVPGRLVLASA